MTPVAASLPAPPRLPTGAALFLDFDGTLTPIAPRPQDVRVPGWVVPRLQTLSDELGGALAIVSGRPLAALDAFLHPLVLPTAGTHGAERRDGAGRVARVLAEPPLEVMHCARGLVGRHAGLILEAKPSGMSLHFRLRPELAEICIAALTEALGPSPVWELLNGDCVCELKQRAVSKATAVHAFLAEPPFAGRVPVFIGDDVTDEDGIRAAQEAGGFGVRVGPGRTQARHRLADTDAVARWLGGETPP